MINVLHKQKHQKPADKNIFERHVKLQADLGEYVAHVIVLQFLLVKRMELIKNAHALYRDNGPLMQLLHPVHMFSIVIFHSAIIFWVESSEKSAWLVRPLRALCFIFQISTSICFQISTRLKFESSTQSCTHAVV